MKSSCFEGKVVLVTGASRGIGRAVAAGFSKSGARVIANYNKSKEDVFALVRALADRGFSIEAIRADVSNGEEVERMVDKVVNKYERIDILVNNAGIRKDNFLAMMSDEDWENVIDVNLKSVYYVSKWVSRVMMRQRRGKIINISSVSALKGVPGQANYSASKGGIISFTKSIARELGTFGIQVNTVTPGLIETDMVKVLSEKQKKKLAAGISLGRFGKPEDVVGGVLFLASDGADYITGQNLVIDGGLSI